MNAREIAGAIPFVGTFVALGTLIKEGASRLFSPTDRKIQKLIQEGNEADLRELLIGKTPDQKTKRLLSESLDVKQLYIYYQDQYTRSAMNVHNAAYELIPFLGLIHHLRFRKTLQEPSTEEKLAIAVQSAVKALTLTMKQDEGDKIEEFYQTNRVAPEGVSLETLNSKIAEAFQARAAVKTARMKKEVFSEKHIPDRAKEVLVLVSLAETTLKASEAFGQQPIDSPIWSAETALRVKLQRYPKSEQILKCINTSDAEGLEDLYSAITLNDDTLLSQRTQNLIDALHAAKKEKQE